MSIHLLRDYVTQTTSSDSIVNSSISVRRAYIPGYLASLFLRRVCRFTTIGQTNWNIDTIGTFLIATADTNSSGTPTFAAGKKASINLGTNFEYFVSIPNSARTVSGIDIGRLLVLRSSANPRFNSGIFLIVGYDTDTNSYLIDYRALGDFPPAETDALEWYLYDTDTNCPIPGTVNTATKGYRGDGNSTTPRIILQSPHALAWQVRLCVETGFDYNVNVCVAQFTTAVGFGGNSAGDYANFGPHLHIPQWYGSNFSLSQRFTGTPGGNWSGPQNIPQRTTIIADDTGQSITIAVRRPLDSFSSSTVGYLLSFGIPNDEPSPLPVSGLGRLYSFGCASDIVFGHSDFFWSINQGNTFGTGNICAGLGATIAGAPATCFPSCWTYVTGVNRTNGPTFDSQASDSPFISSTELLPVDLIVGARDFWSSSTPYIYFYEPRVIGTIPNVKSGRVNFNSFSLTTDSNKSYMHLKNGVYILWEGPQAVP